MGSQAKIRAAHPRSRGEHRITDTLRKRDDGSSPLTRGALAAGILALGVWRLIPAHAGSTMSNVPR